MKNPLFSFVTGDWVQQTTPLHSTQLVLCANVRGSVLLSVFADFVFLAIFSTPLKSQLWDVSRSHQNKGAPELTRN